MNVVNPESETKVNVVQCEVYSRVSGYFRPIAQWNAGKREEFKDRKFAIIQPEEYYE
jgi:anaerobic ribonucleoside-triphosphate reductase